MPKYILLRDRLIRRAPPMLRRCWTEGVGLDIQALQTTVDDLDDQHQTSPRVDGRQIASQQPYSVSWHDVPRCHDNPACNNNNDDDVSGTGYQRVVLADIDDADDDDDDDTANNFCVGVNGSNKSIDATVTIQNGLPNATDFLNDVQKFDTSSSPPRLAAAAAAAAAERQGLQSVVSHIDSKRHPRKRVSTKFQSFNYQTSENEQFLQQQSQVDAQAVRNKTVIRWLINFLIGIYVAVVAVTVTISNKYISRAKLMAVYSLLEDCRSPQCLVAPTSLWIFINMVLVFVGAYLVTFHAPLAAGSGIPNVKCYLNGIRLPGLMSLRTLLAKAGGVVMSVAGGLACGKEGPMIHSGAICASGLAQGEYRFCRRTWKPKLLEPLRNDEERRDFVAAGAACGVSAAFGSPLGGVLFSLEEGASFLKQTLTWRMLLSSMVACMTLNIVLSTINGHPSDMSHPGLISFGYVGDVSYRTLELPIFVLMGVIGGLVGATFVHFNYKITMLRRRFIKNPWLKVFEAVLVAACSAVAFMSLIYAFPNCHPIPGFNETSSALNLTSDCHGHVTRTRRSPDDTVVYNSGCADATSNATSACEHGGHAMYCLHGNDGFVFQGFCPYGSHNRMADILFKPGEGGLHALLHQPLGEWSVASLAVLLLTYHLLATWTYGLSVSSGVFIPSLFTGALWGRIVGTGVMALWHHSDADISKYALVGAAANLGGATRMTLSLTVIVVECTGDITFAIPIMIALIFAKWVGDFFNPGIYDLHIEIQGIPLLSWDPPELAHHLKGCDIMTSPVECLNVDEKLGRLKKISGDRSSHSGYPVVDDYNVDSRDENQFGRLKGFLLKQQLEEILAENMTTMPRIFRFFRGLGLRHLIVVNETNRVVGIITRINLARFRSEARHGAFQLEELVADVE